MLSSARFPLSRWLWLTALGALALRVWISVNLPITGDEAFFYWWGVYPDWGYYDHPPMVGWLIWLTRHLAGESPWALRLPVVALPLLTGGLVYWTFKPINRERAAWAVLLYWLTPINWLNTLITTDTPLIFWSVLSVAFLVRADRRATFDRGTAGLYALSGLAIGCAFLSKYFAVVLGLSYLLYHLLARRERWAGLLLLVICGLPFAAINVAWNMSHGWSNIMFNAINRNQDAALGWSAPLTYIGMLVYLITPVALWVGWRQPRVLWASARDYPLVAALVLVPFSFFAFISLEKVVGLHWVMAFYPYLFVLAALAFPVSRLATLARGVALFTALHVVVVIGIGMTHLEQWRGLPRYYSMVRALRTGELLAAVRTPDTELMADGYSPASVYGYTIRHYVPVFGPGKFHARQDDLLVDFAPYDGKNIRILLSDVPNLADFTPYFDSVQAYTVDIEGARFNFVEGRHFHYEAYRQGVLSEIYRRYYQIPAALPMTGCPFCVRYCGQIRCTQP